jgi:hypothetical protein
MWLSWNNLTNSIYNTTLYMCSIYIHSITFDDLRYMKKTDQEKACRYIVQNFKSH